MPPTNNAEINNIWSSATPAVAGVVEFITLPSGQTARVRRVGLEGLMEAGLLSESDSLLALVDEKHIKRVRDTKVTHKSGKASTTVEESQTIDAASLMRDPAMIRRIVFFIDQAMPIVVAEPMVKSHFKVMKPASKMGELPDTEMIPMEDRDTGFVYTDQIGLEDKMYIFQYCLGGTRDINTFREQSDAAVAGVDDGDEVPRPAKQSTGNRRKRPSRR